MAVEQALIKALADSRWDLAQEALEAGARLDPSPKFSPKANVLDASYKAGDPVAMAWCVERGCSLAAKDFWSLGERVPLGNAMLDQMCMQGLEHAKAQAGAGSPGRPWLGRAAAAGWARLEAAYFGRVGKESLDELFQGDTLLTCCAIWNVPSWTRSALARGADPEVADRYGARPLSKACRAGSFESAEALVQAGAELDAVSLRGATALAATAQVNQAGSPSQANWRSRMDCALLLIGLGADLGSAADPASDARGLWEQAADGQSWGTTAMERLDLAIATRRPGPRGARAPRL